MVVRRVLDWAAVMVNYSAERSVVPRVAKWAARWAVE